MVAGYVSGDLVDLCIPATDVCDMTVLLTVKM